MAGTSPVGTWADPNYNTDTGTTYPGKMDANAAVAKRVVDNFAPRPAGTPNMTVLVDAGCLFLAGNNTVEIAQQTTGTFTAPGSNSRKDWIVADVTTGVISVVTGTPGASPAEPNVPTGKFPIAIVTLTSATTSITSAEIADRRVLPAAQAAAAVTTPVIVTSGSATNAASQLIDLTAYISTYAYFEVFFTCSPRTNAVDLQMVSRDTNGDAGSNHTWTNNEFRTGSTSAAVVTNGASAATYTLATSVSNGNDPYGDAHGVIRLFLDTSNFTGYFSLENNYVDSSNVLRKRSGVCAANHGYAIRGLTIKASSGNIDLRYRVVGYP